VISVRVRNDKMLDMLAFYAIQFVRNYSPWSSVDHRTIFAIANHCGVAVTDIQDGDAKGVA